MMARSLALFALAIGAVQGCTGKGQRLGAWPPSLGKLSVMQVVLKSSTCPTGWSISYDAYGEGTSYSCSDSTTGSEVINVSGCCATIVWIGITGTSVKDVSRRLELITPLLEPAVAAGLRASVPEEDEPQYAYWQPDDLPRPWPNVRASYLIYGRETNMDWSVTGFWPDE